MFGEKKSTKGVNVSVKGEKNCPEVFRITSDLLRPGLIIIKHTFLNRT